MSDSGLEKGDLNASNGASFYYSFSSCNKVFKKCDADVCYGGSRNPKVPELQKAALAGDVAAVKAQLDRWDTDCMMNCFEQEGILHHVVTKGGEASLPALKFLVSCGADMRLGTRDYQTTPLMRAAWLGNVPAACVLLNAGADPNQTRNNGETALILACSSDKKPAVKDETAAEVVRALLLSGADPFIRRNDGRNAYSCAAANQLPVTKRLLRTAMLRWPLSRCVGSEWAVLNYRIAVQGNKGQAIVQKLLQCVNDQDNAKLQAAVTEQNSNYIDGDGESALCLAALFCNLEAVQILLQAGADPNWRQRDMTALCWVMENGATAPATEVRGVINALLQRGADPFARRYDGCNILHWAKRHALDDIVADISAAMGRQDWQGIAEADMLKDQDCELTAKLHNWVQEGKVEKVQKKLENQSRSSAIRRHGDTGATLLMAAAESQCENASEMLDLLCEAEGFDQRDKCGNSALHYAVRAGSVPNLEALLNHAPLSALDAVNSEGVTPLIMATSHVTESVSPATVSAMVQLLLQEGADPLVKADHGCDATQMARKSHFHHARRQLQFVASTKCTIQKLEEQVAELLTKVR